MQGKKPQEKRFRWRKLQFIEGLSNGDYCYDNVFNGVDTRLYLKINNPNRFLIVQVEHWALQGGNTMVNYTVKPPKFYYKEIVDPMVFDDTWNNVEIAISQCDYDPTVDNMQSQPILYNDKIDLTDLLIESGNWFTHVGTSSAFAETSPRVYCLMLEEILF